MYRQIVNALGGFHYGFANRRVCMHDAAELVCGSFERHSDTLAGGLWVVRLRSSFDKARFPSAASDALKRTARDELETLFAAAAHAPTRPLAPGV